MKIKFVNIAMVIFMLFLVTSIQGCKKEETPPEESSIETLEDIISKIQLDESFILVLSSNNCAECDSYYDEVVRYYADNEVNVYFVIVSDDDLTESDESVNCLFDDIKNSVSYSASTIEFPSTIIVKNGEIIDAINGVYRESELELFFVKYIKITMEELNNKLDQEEDFIFLVKATGCYHCYMYEPIVKEYVKKENQKIYYIDLADESDLSITSDTLLSLKDKIYSVNNDYIKLYTPVTVKVNNGNITDAMIGYVEYITLENFLK